MHGQAASGDQTGQNLLCNRVICEKPSDKDPSPEKHGACDFMTPEVEERVGDVSNLLFCNGWIVDANGQVFIYYAPSGTRCTWLLPPLIS